MQYRLHLNEAGNRSGLRRAPQRIVITKSRNHENGKVGYFLLGMCWVFVGVGLGSDAFMAESLFAGAISAWVAGMAVVAVGFLVVVNAGLAAFAAVSGGAFADFGAGELELLCAALEVSILAGVGADVSPTFTVLDSGVAGACWPIDDRAESRLGADFSVFASAEPVRSGFPLLAAASVGTGLGSTAGPCGCTALGLDCAVGAGAEVSWATGAAVLPWVPFVISILAIGLAGCSAASKATKPARLTRTAVRSIGFMTPPVIIVMVGSGMEPLLLTINSQKSKVKETAENFGTRKTGRP